MTYLLNHNRGNRSSKSIFYWVFFILLITYLIGAFSPLKNYLSNKLIPFFALGSSIYNKLDILPDWFKQRKTLVDKVDTLEKELEALKVRDSDYVALSYENQRLRVESALEVGENFNRASIISRFPQTPFDTIMINKGTNSSIQIGDLVLASERSLLGTTVEVYPDYSIVVLNSSKNYKERGFVSRTGEILEISGVGSNNMIAEVPFDFDIIPGDGIVASYSSNFTLAIVGSVEESVSLGVKKIIMSLPVNVSKIETVFVLKK